MKARHLQNNLIFLGEQITHACTAARVQVNLLSPRSMKLFLGSKRKRRNEGIILATMFAFSYGNAGSFSFRTPGIVVVLRQFGLMDHTLACWEFILSLLLTGRLICINLPLCSFNFLTHKN